MENSDTVYIKFNDPRNMYSDLRTFSSINGLRGVVYNHGGILFKDGKRRSQKLSTVDAKKRTPKTHKIEKRNERERFRVQAVNDAFCRLRRLIPTIAARRKRVSKVKTLKKAVQYIIQLQAILQSSYA
ncbi:helix-loop-helix protein 1-like [Bradysia coprophila]|uniref:helix-loop-helix protein 1-like n=1 Tax=Bradysia coprophila TaxID=38358 RepID=UPI00187DABD8|nr:helix-loop-helix protein 1-like [Bradysia coprophila]